LGKLSFLVKIVLYRIFEGQHGKLSILCVTGVLREMIFYFILVFFV